MDDKELREAMSKILVKWHMPTRQAAIGELLLLFNDHLARAVTAARVDELEQWKAKCIATGTRFTGTGYVDLRLAQLQAPKTGEK
jgi:hypothetical protein